MPPHCDSLDGPVVNAARRALDEEDVALVLPYVPADAEGEVRDVFGVAVKARTQGPEAGWVADRYLFETVVRLHRAGEGASFTGLKPAGLDVGPVVPVAEAAIKDGSPDRLAAFLADAVRQETYERFADMEAARRHAGEGVAAARTHVEQVLGLQVWAHRLYHAMHAAAHEHGH
jgi:hypothetical protein